MINTSCRLIVCSINSSSLSVSTTLNSIAFRSRNLLTVNHNGTCLHAYTFKIVVILYSSHNTFSLSNYRTCCNSSCSIFVQS